MAAANLISVNTARRYQALPVGFVDKRDAAGRDGRPDQRARASTTSRWPPALDCRVAVAAEEDIEALIGRLNTLQSAVSEAVTEERGTRPRTSSPRSATCEVSAEDAPVIKLVYSILGQAVGEGASDVHFEPDEGEMRVRFRVDGVLREAAHVPKRMVNAVISRVKIMSDLNIAEKRVPQDGRVSVTVEDRRVDLRVTTLPTQRGEGATIRILDKDNAQRSLDELGMDGDRRASASRTPSTRPTARSSSPARPARASRRPSTRRCRTLNEVEKNIITIEDPVEYRLDGINQINVNRKAGLDFATGLRSILRADPDIVMVGEIRDGETARIAIEAALTGHMMLTTLHTNDAPGAITRLTKMGIEAFLIASAVDCVVAQRLARKLCTPLQAARRSCRRRRWPRPASGSAARSRPTSRSAARAATRAATSGRVGIYSVMEMSERIKEMTVDQAARGRDRRRRPRGGDAHPARGRRRQGARRADQPRGGPPCHRLSLG